MKFIRKIIKMTFIIIGSLVLLVLIAATLFMNFYPSFGGSPTETEKQHYAKTGHYNDGKFVNEMPTSMDLGFKGFVKVLYEFYTGGKDRRPEKDIPVLKIDSTEIATHQDKRAQLTWFGHSAFLLEMDGKIILLDPMFGPSPAPHPLLGTKRYSSELPIAVEKLPHIDAIIMSHDHYDHLDYESIMKLKDKTDRFYMPLGVGSHFRAWGIEKGRIHEFDWWDETSLDHIQLVCTPARHFSGRGMFDRMTTLWASWVIRGKDDNIYFSGDSGYGPHFKAIGEKYGPFDIAMMECGQYNERWKNIHMMPEQTAQAGVDVGAKVIMPIHWGAFTLALHTWTDPVIRVSEAAGALDLPLTTPRIGEPFVVQASDKPKSKWWEGIN